MSCRFLRQKSLRQVIVQRRLLTPSEMNYLFAYVAYPHPTRRRHNAKFIHRCRAFNFNQLTV